MLEVAIEELKKVAMDFYNVAKIKIVLYDAECRLLYSYPQKMEGFCAAIRTNDVLAKKCFECDKIGFEMCRKNNKPFIYKCYMNLSEAIAPITENGVITGYELFFDRIVRKHNVDVCIIFVHKSDYKKQK